MDEIAETAGRDIHEIARAFTPHTDEIDRGCLFARRISMLGVDARQRTPTDRANHLRCRVAQFHADTARAMRNRDSVNDFVQRAVAPPQ